MLPISVQMRVQVHQAAEAKMQRGFGCFACLDGYDDSLAQHCSDYRNEGCVVLAEAVLPEFSRSRSTLRVEVASIFPDAETRDRFAVVLRLLGATQMERGEYEYRRGQRLQS